MNREYAFKNTGAPALGIDIGGTSIKAAIVDTVDGTLSGDLITRPTAPGTVASVSHAVAEIAAAFTWTGPIGCGFPGVIKSGVARMAAHLSPEWLGIDVPKALHTAAKGTLTVLNDADAAGLAEMRFGAGQIHNGTNGGVVLLVTFGTGIGTALFYHGQVIPNTEFGHIYVEGTEAEELAAAVVRLKLNLGWEDWGLRVNTYLQELEKLLSPDLFIIGGGVVENYEKFRPFLKAHADIRPAHFGNNAGVIGAAIAARQLSEPD